MANSDKNIVITPNNDQSGIPQIQLSAGSATVGPLTFNIKALPSNGGTVTIDAGGGQLWTIRSNVEGKAFAVSTPGGYEVLSIRNTGEIVFCESYGRLNIPAKPAFRVWQSTSSSAFAANSVATWNNVDFNNYEGFNNSDRFTAPHKGIYHFSCMMLSNPSTRLFHRFRINGSDVYGTWSESYQGTDYQTNTITMTVPLNINDYVQVYVASNAGYGNVYANFNGFQIA